MTNYPIEDVPTWKIRPGDNDRKTFNPKALRDLADNIAENGLAQPITVRPIKDNDGNLRFYEIVAGERRYRAISQYLNWPTIPAIVRDLDDEAASAIMLAENLHRADLNPIEEARAYNKRMAKFGWSMAEVARKANVSEGKVKGRLSLLCLTKDVQALVISGDLPLGFAEKMSILDTNHQIMAIAWLRKQKTQPTVRAFTGVVNNLHEKQMQAEMFSADEMGSLISPDVSEAIEESDTGKLVDILPTLKTLPGLPTRKGGIGAVIDTYVAGLLKRGSTCEARIIIHLWVQFMDANYCHVSAYDSKTLAALATNTPNGTRAGALEV